MKIHVRQAKNGQWYYHILGDNGRILSTSETYSTKGNAKRAADRFADRVNVTTACMAFVIEPEPSFEVNT